MDHSCLLWEKKCDGSTGACLYYNNHQMALLLMAVCAACKVLNIVCGLLCWKLYMRRLLKGHVPQPRLEHMLTVGETENNVESVTNQASGISNPAMESEI